MSVHLAISFTKNYFMQKFKSNGGSLVSIGDLPRSMRYEGISAYQTGKGSVIVLEHGERRFELIPAETEVDGETFPTALELIDKITSFKKGGDTGEGVNTGGITSGVHTQNAVGGMGEIISIPTGVDTIKAAVAHAANENAAFSSIETITVQSGTIRIKTTSTTAGETLSYNYIAY